MKNQTVTFKIDEYNPRIRSFLKSGIYIHQQEKHIYAIH